MSFLKLKYTKSHTKIFSSLILIFWCSFLLNSLVYSQTKKDEEIITIDSSIVILNATITDSKGATVNALTKKDFRLFENGFAQEIDFFEPQKTPFAATILIDTSGSMAAQVSTARAATIKFLDGLRVDDNVAIFNFDTKVTLVQDFSNLRDLNPQVFDLKANGWTVLNDAIYDAALELEKRPEKRRAIIVLSDGADTKSEHSASKALAAALRANAVIYTVDMSAMNSAQNKQSQNRSVLKNFAKKTGGQFIQTPGGQAMRQAFENIVADLGTQYTLGYYSNNSENDGKWRKIELKIPDKDLQIRTREGYHAPKN